ncbi:1,6-anhydro-N-acetylmuramyl-L-alanine amidase AmpD [Moraxella cuniculi]|uniref:1,6-anhydro-N-acetylmuramyl-L-alanine amidase AmpD n=2 Tax=Moraxella cuniculi TaxID=34061 RepID=A0A3S4RM48_9GAMM|nr:1,6-anhydro-N-acetylmuramyl-L-alanine amidase AmpD [Moraxella cuniculi]
MRQLCYNTRNFGQYQLMNPSSFFIKDGILQGSTFVASPNFNARPADFGEISAIIIHNISLPPAQFNQSDGTGTHYVKAFFQNKLIATNHPYFAEICTLQVSAHLFIERDGTVTQFVNFNDRAWHAGISSYLGRANCNDFSIGIELEGTDHQDYEEIQYEVLSQIIVAIYHAYPATRRQLAGHSDIAPNRKTDPGKHFDWQKLRSMVAQLYLSTSKQSC